MEWTAAMSTLTAAQLDRGMRRLVFGWKGGPPSLPDFMRLCRSLGNDEFDEGSQGNPMLESPDTWRGDEWEAAANRYLMGHIAKLMKKDPKRLGKPASVQLMQAPVKDLQDLGIDLHYLDASGAFVENVRRLVTAKNAWVTDMRDIAVKGGVPVSDQQAIWQDYMKRAGMEA